MHNALKGGLVPWISMIDSFIHIIQNTLLPLGAGGIFLAGVLEEFISPVPSPLVMLGAGFFFLEGAVDAAFVQTLIFTVAIPVALGITIGSLVIYGAAYAFGKPILVRWGNFIGLNWSDVERLQVRMRGTSRDEWLVFLARAVPIIPSTAIAAFCGVIRMRVVKYLIITAAGVFIRAIILALIGWQAGSLYQEYAHIIARYEKWVLLVILAAALAFIAYRIYKRNRPLHGGSTSV